MTQHAYRRPNLFSPLTKNNGESGGLKSPTFETNRKKFYTVHAQAKNGLFLEIISVIYKSPI